MAAPAASIAAPFSLHDALGAPKSLTLNGATRVRYEAISGQARPGFRSSEDLLVIRTNIFAEYRTGALRFGAEVFDSRSYGARRGSVISTSDVNALEPVQAYVAADLGPVLGEGSGVTAQFGRMAFNIGSRRLVAADDYRNTTNGYTGLRVDAHGRTGETLTVIYVAPQIRLPETFEDLRSNRVRLDRETDDLLLWGGVAGKSGLPDKATLEVEYFGLDERDAPGRPTRNRNLHTFGGRLVRSPQAGRLDYEFEALHQLGTVRTGLAATAALQNVSADFLHAEVGYQFRGRAKPHLALEYDRASGDHGAGRNNRFDTLFGMRRADYAPAGLFSSLGRANSVLVGARIEAEPAPRWDLMLHYAPMWLASSTDAFSTTNVRDPAGRSGRFAGHLAEARLRYWLVPRSLRLEGNGVLLAKGRFLARAPNAPRNGDTKYLSLALTASF